MNLVAVARNTFIYAYIFFDILCICAQALVLLAGPGWTCECLLWLDFKAKRKRMKKGICKLSCNPEKGRVSCIVARIAKARHDPFNKDP